MSFFDFYVNSFSLDSAYVGHANLAANNFGTTLKSESFATESYELTGGKVTAIDYWSAGITDGAYAHDTNDKLGSTTALSNKKGIRARRIVESNGTFTEGNYPWIRDGDGADNPDNNLLPSSS